MATEYIEKQAALDIVNGWRDQLIPTYGENDEYVKCIELVAEILESMHAADVRSVRWGRWALHPDPNCKGWDVCTACGIGCKRREYGTNPDGTDYVTEWSYPYCPNCGSYNGG